MGFPQLEAAMNAPSSNLITTQLTTLKQAVDRVKGCATQMESPAHSKAHAHAVGWALDEIRKRLEGLELKVSQL
jgi:hypothetical protein